MKTTLRILFSEDFGALYTDIKTKQLRHVFPAMVPLMGEGQDKLCMLDMAAEDILEQNLLFQDDTDWTIKIPTLSFQFSPNGYMEYQEQPCPYFWITTL